MAGGGPGETKLEINRRRARNALPSFSAKLTSCRKKRHQRRKNAAAPRAAGDWHRRVHNAGKSTLLNTLTRSEVLVENKLFATLDPTSRRMRFPDERELIVTDTVGFISGLAAGLGDGISRDARGIVGNDLFRMCSDASDPAMEEQRRPVEKILFELELSDKPKAVCL